MKVFTMKMISVMWLNSNCWVHSNQIATKVVMLPPDCWVFIFSLHVYSNMRTGDPTSQTASFLREKTVLWSFGMRMASGMMFPAITTSPTPARREQVRTVAVGRWISTSTSSRCQGRRVSPLQVQIRHVLSCCPRCLAVSIELKCLFSVLSSL